MAQECRQVPDGPDFSARERLALIQHINKLSSCVGGVERIHQTVVPLNYSRHTLRALTVFLFSLPFCFLRDLKLLTGPVLFLMSWLLFGKYCVGGKHAVFCCCRCCCALLTSTSYLLSFCHDLLVGVYEIG
jgi:predicted membrane chloride channel (bestrophin family)